MMQLSRRNFFKMTGAATAGVVVMSLLKSTSASAQTSPETLASTVQRNHGHALVVSLADFTKKGAATYDIQGQSGHPHSLIVTQEAINTLLKTKVIEIESTNNSGHSHVVRLEIK